MRSSYRAFGRGIHGAESKRKTAGTSVLLEAKAKQASKLAEIREALIVAGFDPAAKQATVLRVGRSTAWAVLNLDRRAGPSANVIRRILSSPGLPPVSATKSGGVCQGESGGLYGHSEPRSEAFSDQFPDLT